MSKWGSLPWSNIILSFTAMAVLWYTLEARRLSELSKKQIEINIRPIIVVRWDGSTLRLKNIGRSPALNISIKDIVDKDARLNFDTMPVCEVGVEPGIGYKLFIKDIHIVASGEVDSWMRFYFNHNELKNDESYKIIIDYHDVESGKWRTEYLVTKEGEKFVKAERI